VAAEEGNDGEKQLPLAGPTGGPPATGEEEAPEPDFAAPESPPSDGEDPETGEDVSDAPVAEESIGP
jgi:hypothetical protein